MSVNRHQICPLIKQIWQRYIFVKPTRKASIFFNKLWKLNATIYHLHDASKLWNLNALNKLQAKRWRTDPSVFLWQRKGKLNVLLCTHFEKCDKPIKRRFTIGWEQLYGFQILQTKYQTKSIWNIFRSKWLNLLNWKQIFS